TLAVILVCPHCTPQGFVICRHHATLAASGHDFVLAETPGTYMTDAAHAAALIASTMRLGAVLDDLEAILSGQRHDRIHIAGPASKVYADHGPGARSQYRFNGLGRKVAA